jgi:hypothetical protein
VPHRIDNRSDALVCLLVVSTMLVPEVNEYPTRGRCGLARSCRGRTLPDDAVTLLVRLDQQPAGYLDGES